MIVLHDAGHTLTHTAEATNVGKEGTEKHLRAWQFLQDIQTPKQNNRDLHLISLILCSYKIK